MHQKDKKKFSVGPAAECWARRVLTHQRAPGTETWSGRPHLAAGPLSPLPPIPHYTSFPAHQLGVQLPLRLGFLLLSSDSFSSFFLIAGTRCQRLLENHSGLSNRPSSLPLLKTAQGSCIFRYFSENTVQLPLLGISVTLRKPSTNLPETRPPLFFLPISLNTNVSILPKTCSLLQFSPETRRGYLLKACCS